MSDGAFGRIPSNVQHRYKEMGLWNAASLGALLSSRLRAEPNQRFRVWSKHAPRELRFSELDELARRCAAGMRASGVRAGDRVAFQLPNSVEAATVLVSATMLGAAVVPIASSYGRKELVDIIEASGARLLVTIDRVRSRNYLDELRESRHLMPGLESVVVCGDPGDFDAIAFSELASPAPLATLAPSAPDDACLVAFTSGTSGRPKGVVHTNRSLGAEIRSHLYTMVPRNVCPQVVASPIAHAAGMVLGLFGPVHRGEPVNLADNFDVDFLLDVCHEHHLSPGGGASIFLSALINHEKFTDEIADRMKYAILGGSTVPTALVSQAESRGITVLRTYGLTEHPTITASRMGDTPNRLRMTDGRPLPGVEVSIRQADGTEAPRGVAGEIFSRGPDRCAGYLDPALNEQSFDPEGWLATGDVGVLDGEGYLTITGRTKDIIIRNGFNIAPSEVENALLSLPSVKDIAVVGVPDARTGERLVAFVESCDVRRLTLEEIRSHLARVGLAKPKWPEQVQMVDELPRTASGKIQKHVLRASVTRS